MSAQYCPGCGAPVTPGSQFCAYCGKPVAAASGPGAAPAPLPSAGPTPPPYPAAPQMEPAARPGPRRWIVIVVVLVIVIAIVGGLLAYEASAPTVTINAIYFYAPDNACGLGVPANQAVYDGFSDDPGVTDTVGFIVPSFNSTTCTIQSLVTNTSGFTIVNTNLPIAIAAEGNGTLFINVTLPGSSWTGNLNLVLS